MDRDAVINRIAYTTGCSRKEVLELLKQFGMLEYINPLVKANERMKNDL